MPTDENQSTGLERLQVLAAKEGVEVFDFNPLDSSRIGTLADPIKVFSWVCPDFHWLIVVNQDSLHLTHESTCLFTTNFYRSLHASLAALAALPSLMSSSG